MYPAQDSARRTRVVSRKRLCRALAAGWSVLGPVSGCAIAAETGKLPAGFVYLRDVAPSIAQDMRYATADNFTGKPVPGYEAAECVLQRPAAEALKRAQDAAQAQGHSLKVYDCYRPARAVRSFLAWAAAAEDGRAKRYHPRLQKSQLVPDYIAPQSGHSTGFAVDVTLVPAGAASQETGARKGSCAAPAGEREPDNSLDMGTAFDCFDPKANTGSHLASPEQRKFRRLLKSILEAAGFQNYAAEWWHFSYPAEDGRHSYNFPIQPRTAR